MTDRRIADSSGHPEALNVPGPDTPEGALWRMILGGDASAPFMIVTDNASFVHPAGSDGLDRPELARRNNSSVNHQVGEWAFDSLANEHPEARQLAAEALCNITVYEEIDAARRWMLYEGGIYAFACAFSPNESVRQMARRYAETIQAIEIELASGEL